MKGKRLTHRRRNPGYYAIFAVMSIGAIAMLFPIIWMILCSFKTQNEMYQMPPTFLPNQWNLNNYINVFKQMPFGRYYLNSLGTSALNMVVGVLTSSLIGYVFAKYDFPAREPLFLLVLACMMIPYETLMPTVYKIMVKFGWTNSYLVLTIPYFCNIFGIFLMRQFFLDLPNDYMEAAEIDGCGQLRTWWSVAMPMARSTVATLVIFLFMGTYNSFLWPLISVDSRKYFTLPVGIQSMLSDRGSQYAMLMAASSMVIVPVCIIFAAMQKQFIEGMTAGGIKG
jgi:ABC-type glycerol-3-phosphate transport system permease component